MVHHFPGGGIGGRRVIIDLPVSITLLSHPPPDLFGLPAYPVMSSAIKDSFISSFSICIILTFFSYPIVLARISRIILEGSGERGNPWLVPNLRGKALSFSTLSMMLAMFFVHVLYHVEEVSLYSLFTENFYHEWLLDFVKCFFCIYLYDVIFLL